MALSAPASPLVYYDKATVYLPDPLFRPEEPEQVAKSVQGVALSSYCVFLYVYECVGSFRWVSDT